MSKTIQRPLACRNAHCGAMCSPAEAYFFDNPSECYKYVRRDDLYRKTEILDKVKKAREEIESNKNTTSMLDCAKFYNNGLDMALAILDKLIESEEIE